MSQYQLKKTLECKKSLNQALALKLPTQLATEAKKMLAELK